MGEADGFKKPGKAPDVPCEPFSLYFLFEIQARVGVQDIGWLGRADHKRQQSDLQRLSKIELRQFRRHEGMHGTVHGPSAQEVHAPPPKLSGARSRQDEPRRRRFLQESVNDG